MTQPAEDNVPAEWKEVVENLGDALYRRGMRVAGLDRPPVADFPLIPRGLLARPTEVLA